MARSFGRLFAGSGAIAIFNYSHKLVELPFGIAISAFAIVTFPRLSKMMSSLQKDTRETLQFIRLSIRFLFLLSFPVSIGLIYIFWQMHEAPLQLFNIPTESFKSILQLTLVGLVALPLRGLSIMHLTIMSAKRDTLNPFWIYSGGLVLSFPIFYIMGKSFGLLGISIGMGTLYVLTYSAELLILKFKHGISLFKELFNRLSLEFIFTTLVIYSGLAWILGSSSALSVNVNLSLKFALALLAGILCLVLGILRDKELKALLLKRIKPFQKKP